MLEKYLTQIYGNTEIGLFAEILNVVINGRNDPMSFIEKNSAYGNLTSHIYCVHKGMINSAP